MAIEVYLGKVPTNIENWIKANSQPTEHAETWYKYAGDTEWKTVMIGGEIALMQDGGEPTGQIDNPTNIVAIEIGTGPQENPLTSIGEDAFYQCQQLTSVFIPNSVTNIGAYAFQECTGLTSLIIPSSVITIGMAAFLNCSQLISIVFQGKTLEQVQNIGDEYGNKEYPWGIGDTSIITVA